MYPATIPIAPTNVWQFNPACLADVATRTWPNSPAQTWSDDRNLREPPRPEELPLAWPDKATLVIAVLIAALCVIVWTTTLASAGIYLYGRLDHALALWAAVAELGFALPLWLVLRLIDVVNGGPTRRREARRARHIEPRFETESEIATETGTETETETRTGAEIVPFPGAQVAGYSKNATERTSML